MRTQNTNYNYSIGWKMLAGRGPIIYEQGGWINQTKGGRICIQILPKR